MSVNKCNCECHKQQDKSDLKKCQEQNKKKTRELNELRKKLITATIIICIVGTIVGKEVVDKALEYFQTFDKVKNTINNARTTNTDYEIQPQIYHGISPSPSALAVFMLPLLKPTPRRR